VAVQLAQAARRLVATLGGTGAPRDALTAARDLSAAADAALQAAIDLARAAGYSWREIGEVLGTSRQAAFQRFGHPVDPRTGEPMSREVPPDAADRAVAIFAWHNEGRWDEILAQLDDRIGARLDADLLARGWAHMAGLFGRFEGAGEPFARRAGDDVLVDIPLHWEAGDARGIVRFDAEGKVAGLAIRPLPGGTPCSFGPHAQGARCPARPLKPSIDPGADMSALILAIDSVLLLGIIGMSVYGVRALPADAQLPLHFGLGGYNNWQPRNVGLLMWPVIAAAAYVIIVVSAGKGLHDTGHGLRLPLPVGLTIALAVILVNYVGAIRAAFNRVRS